MMKGGSGGRLIGTLPLAIEATCASCSMGCRRFHTGRSSPCHATPFGLLAAAAGTGVIPADMAHRVDDGSGQFRCFVEGQTLAVIVPLVVLAPTGPCERLKHVVDIAE